MDRANSFIGASSSSSNAASSSAEAKLEDFEAQQWSSLDREKMDGVVVIVDPVSHFIKSAKLISSHITVCISSYMVLLLSSLIP